MTRNHAQHGFSLIELLVVLAIIGLIVGLAFPAVAAFRRQAKASHTTAILNGLSAVSDEFRIKTGIVIDHSDASGINNTIEHFVEKAQQVESCDKMLRALGGATIVIKSGSQITSIHDAWGTPLRYAKMVSHSDSASFDDSLPEYPQPFFASAGPDQKWGVAADGVSEQNKQDAADNLYSFNVD